MKSFLSISALLLLVSCGGGGATLDPLNDEPNVLVGRFIDSAVSNIGYRTDTLFGTTNLQGEFEYVEGENITFFIGELELPATMAKSVITPLDLAASDDLHNTTVVNIIRLLQSLDQDGTPDNGISIPSSSAAFASAVDFSLSETAFAALPEVTMLVANSGSTNTSLIAADDAVLHLADTLGYFTVGPFTANYYDNSTFVASESVTRPSINYAYSEFNNIDSQNFTATWSGTLEVFSQPKQIEINFYVSWADVSLYIDNVEISSWSNSKKTIQQDLAVGTHEITVTYANHWHTTEFNVSFTDMPVYLKAQVPDYLTPLIDENTQVIYVGAYESGSLYNTSTVTLENTADKVFLFLSSYSSINWIIENPHNVEISGIAYGSYGPGPTIVAGTDVATFEIDNFSYAYNNGFTAPVADIVDMIGTEPDYLYGEYALTQAEISGTP